MKEPSDVEQRRLFVENIDTPYSVIAPAGVGKTKSIVDRVYNIIVQKETPLAVVTYTKKAAAEMRGRLESKLAKNRIAYPTGRLFVGTIHSLCLELMRRHSVDWGLPAQRQLFSDIDALYSRYISECPNPLVKLPKEVAERYWRYIKPLSVKEIEQTNPCEVGLKEFTPAPLFQAQQLLQLKLKGHAHKKLQEILSWLDYFHDIVAQGSMVMPALPRQPDMPKDIENYADSSRAVYDKVFGEYEEWYKKQRNLYAQYLANDFWGWRKKKGFYIYEDLITIVNENLNAPYGWTVVLDEAQDTSPTQLELLIKLAAIKENKLQLTMVGDPQQSIYSERVKLEEYLKVHKELIEKYGAEELTFSVTFRCSQAVIDWVNKIGPTLLTGQAQAEYVRLNPRPEVDKGSVLRWDMGEFLVDEKLSQEDRDWALAGTLAEKVKELGIPKGEEHKVAFLATTRAQLHILAQAFNRKGYQVQVHAEAATSLPVERIAQALVHLFAYPFDSFEIVGLIREIYPVDDVALANLARQNKDRITLVEAPTAENIDNELFRALDEMHKAYFLSKEKSLPEALASFANTLNIAEKMQSLEAVYGGGLVEAWENEWIKVLTISTSVNTATELLSQLSSGGADVGVRTGALQLMTIHKSKGLEWQVVVVPYVYRGARMHREDEKLSKDQKDDSEKTAATKVQKNFERLLYVLQTRAKEHLVFVNDSSYYENNKNSIAEALGFTFQARHWEDFKNLPVLTTLPFQSVTPVISHSVANNLLPSSDWEKPLLVCNPSSFAKEVENTSEIPVEGGAVYGEWWHSLWEGMSNKTKEKNFYELLLAEACKCAYPLRARKEIEQLRQSPLWGILTAPDALLQPELPLLARVNDSVMEGRIDLLLVQNNVIRVIDWKTNHLPEAELRLVYSEQLKAYKEALEGLLKAPVLSSLYSTVGGVWIEL